MVRVCVCVCVCMCVCACVCVLGLKVDDLCDWGNKRVRNSSGVPNLDEKGGLKDDRGKQDLASAMTRYRVMPAMTRYRVMDPIRSFLVFL